MKHRPALLAATLASLPVTSLYAQHLPAHAALRATVAAPSAAPLAGDPSLRLVLSGEHPTIEACVPRDLAVVDVQRADLDADGDVDALVMVDLSSHADGPKPGFGRGVAVVWNTGHAFRGQTVAAIPFGDPSTGGFNWGRVETLRTGEAPLVHLMGATAGASGWSYSDTVLRANSQGFVAVHASVAQGERATVRGLATQTVDLDNDGTRELIERVTESTGCAGDGCATDDGVRIGRESYRVMQWDAHTARFVEAPALRTALDRATGVLATADARWLAGDHDGHDTLVRQAYAVDPLDARVRMAYVHVAVRAHDYDNAMDALDFTWPIGFGREALRLQRETADHGRTIGETASAE